MVFLLNLLGVLLVLEGIPYFGFPRAVKHWAVFLQKAPEKTLRLMGLAIIVIGLAMLFALRYV
ncbi:MAG: DUF2065 family protein [Thermodesulfobacteriota bacterium]